jgi:rhodanese-related sulfurtransferase
MNTMKTVNKYDNLDSRAFERKLNEHPNAVLLDVRTAAEFQSERIPSAINIDLVNSGFLKQIATLNKTKTYFVYCRSGGRSGQACSIMSKEGLNVYNLSGGISNWGGDTI